MLQYDPRSGTYIGRSLSVEAAVFEEVERQLITHAGLPAELARRLLLREVLWKYDRRVMKR